MTYREAIQVQIAAMQSIYDNCEGLRDAATEDEKKYWNTMRGKLSELWPVLQKLDKQLSDSRATMMLAGNYFVNEK